MSRPGRASAWASAAVIRGAALAGVVALWACAAPVLGSQTAAGVTRPLSSARFVLRNGLTALVNEDHTAPVVAVDVWYHLGAKDERPGRTGLAHLCEHLMGEGSPNERIPAKVFVQSLGGTSAHWGATTEDITHFFATVPSNQLETMLWLESDRMASPLTRADSAHLGPVRTVIAQERAQSRETPVFGVADGLTLQALFPGEHPSRIDPLGPMTDLNSATAAEAREFCLPFYVPNNAVVALSGDVSPAIARMLIEKYFGGIPRGPAPPRADVPPSRLASPVRVVLEDPRSRTPRLRIAWPAASFASDDRIALNALASVLARDRTGRLSKLLVYDLGLANRVLARNADLERSGIFQIEVFPRPGASLTRIEELIDSVLAELPARPVTAAELRAFTTSNAVVAITSLQTRAARADTLAQGELFANDPVAYAKQVDRALALTPADVNRVARRYLTDARVVMSMVPAGALNAIAKPQLPYTNITPAAPKAVP